MSHENKLGAWTPFRAITAAEKTMFEKAIAKLTGVGYTPLAVKTQVVAGTSYKFLCEAKVVYPGAEMYNAKIVIYKPLQSEAEVVSVTSK